MTTTIDLVDDRDLCADSTDARPAPSGYVCLRAGCRQPGEYFVRDAGVLCGRDAARRIRRRQHCPRTRSYRVHFERVGRTHDVPALEVTSRAGTVRQGDVLAERIYHHARPWLRSSDVEVFVDFEKHSGFIMCGFRNGGDFTVDQVQRFDPGCYCGRALPNCTKKEDGTCD